MYLLLRVFFSTTSADCSCHSLWKKKSGSLWNCNSWTMNSSSQDTVLFHCCLAQSAISLLCSLFAAQVHHLTYVGIFKQIFFPQRSLFHLWNHGASCWLHRTPHTLPSFFSVRCLSVPTPHTSLFFTTRSLTLFFICLPNWIQKISPLDHFPHLLSVFQTSSSFAKYQQSWTSNFSFLFYCFSIFCPFTSCNFPCS